MITVPVDLALSAWREPSFYGSESVVSLDSIATAEPPRKLSLCPFRVLVDTNEGAPYRFTGIESSDDNDSTLLVSTVTFPLYTHGKRSIVIDGKEYSKGLADYSIEGLMDLVQVERKSLDDLYGTLGGRRDDFEAEICRLNECEFAAVVVEATWHEITHQPPARSRLNPKSVEGTIQAWSIRYPSVHWFACGGRAGGERMTFKLLEKFWRVRRFEKMEGAVAQ